MIKDVPIDLHVDYSGQVREVTVTEEISNRARILGSSVAAGAVQNDRIDLCYEVGSFDRALWNDLLVGDSVARESMRAGRQHYEAFSSFGREVFHRLRAHAPQKLEEPNPGSGWAQRLHASGEEDVERLRQRTMGDRIRSTHATIAVCDTLIDHVEHPKEQVPDARKEQEAEEMIRRMVERAKDPERKEELEQEAEAMAQLAAETAQSADEAAEDMDGVSMRGAMRRAVQAANERLDDIDAVEDCFGFGTGIGDRSILSDPSTAATLANLLKQNRGKLRKVIELAGRMKRDAANEQRKQPRYGVGEPVDVTKGDDLLDLMPEEYVNRAMHRPLFYARYLDRALLVRKRTVDEPKKKGPIVMAIDCSGSMGGDRHAWAMATAIAYLQVAREQRRSFAVFFFDRQLYGEQRFPASSPVDPDKLIELLSFSQPGGGTDFEEPLSRCRLIIDEEPDFELADIIMITDGECVVGEDWLQDFNRWREDKGVRVFSILIGVRAEGSTNQEFSNEVVSLDRELRNDKEALGLFGKV